MDAWNEKGKSKQQKLTQFFRKESGQNNVSSGNDQMLGSRSEDVLNSADVNAESETSTCQVSRFRRESHGF